MTVFTDGKSRIFSDILASSREAWKEGNGKIQYNG
jgi:hypothetical protein